MSNEPNSHQDHANAQQSSARPEAGMHNRALALEEYKAKLSYRKFIWGSVVVALTATLIPPLFQLATAVLEYHRTQAQLAADMKIKEAEARLRLDQFNQQFVSHALNQDVEIRLRLAQFMSDVSQHAGWRSYLVSLKEQREHSRRAIDAGEAQLRAIQEQVDGSVAEELQIKRALEWTYAEVGYAPQNSSSMTDPRAPAKFATERSKLEDDFAKALTEIVSLKKQLQDMQGTGEQALAGNCPDDVEARANIRWVVQLDSGARAIYMAGRGAGLTPYDAVLQAQGHNTQSQETIRRYGATCTNAFAAELGG